MQLNSIQKLFAALRRTPVPTWVFLWSAAIVYTYAYLVNPALPGNNLSYPEGWWGWFDQSQYLLSAKSWLARDLAPARHYYPPLYPLIGAAFYHWIPVHPFFFFDGAAFVVFIYTFLKFASRYISRIETFAVVAVAIYFNPPIMENFAIPWSTAGTITIYSAVVLMLMRLHCGIAQTQPQDAFKTFLSAFCFSAIFGLLVILRPVDAGLAAIFFPSYLILQFRRDRQLPDGRRLQRALLTCVALGCGLAVGVALFAIYNAHVFGSPLGGYIKSTATSSGYIVGELAHKAFSLLFDANTYFLEPGSSIVSKYPWILLSILGLLVFLVRGDALLRILALAIVFHFCLYAPYGDLLPNGVWRFKNIHYFKWMFPYLMLFAWLLVRWVLAATNEELPLKSSPARTVAIRLATICIVGLAICSLRFSAHESLASSEVSTDTAVQDIKIHVAASSAKEIDFIDLQGVSGGFTEIYFGPHRLTIDGRTLSLTRDFRLVPAPWGVRLLLIHPASGSEIVFRPAPAIKVSTTELKVFVGDYHLSLGRPKLKRDVGCPMGAPVC
ncbi:hypothetical protein [Caballeronia sp. dw_276]|uniref:hypothetical protein n=1 Tax=Caballeronia sp. dw_276 TaxID=2719795 RepID=UPI001BD63EC1|nr:hypothetical protein [Caballeronia sp. dw_276]